MRESVFLVTSFPHLMMRISVYLSSKVKADPDERKTVGKEVGKEQHEEAIVQRASDRRIEKIVVFYSDKTFTEYLPEG